MISHLLPRIENHSTTTTSWKTRRQRRMNTITNKQKKEGIFRREATGSKTLVQWIPAIGSIKLMKSGLSGCENLTLTWSLTTITLGGRIEHNGCLRTWLRLSLALFFRKEPSKIGSRLLRLFSTFQCKRR